MTAPGNPGLLTPEAVLERVEEIRSLTSDEEEAHGAEDRLYFDVLVAIAEDRCPDPRACAQIAITTQALDFRRHYS